LAQNLHKPEPQGQNTPLQHQLRRFWLGPTPASCQGLAWELLHNPQEFAALGPAQPLLSHSLHRSAMTDPDPRSRSRPATWGSPDDTSQEHSHFNTSPAANVDPNLLCDHWMSGKGCKYFFKGQCRKLHVDSLGGMDYLRPNFCHRYGRGRCHLQFFCHHLHATDLPEARQIFLDICRQQGIPQKPRQLMAPLSQAILAAAAESDSEPRNFTEFVLDTLERAPALQHPKIRECLDIVCKEIRDSAH
jgi:hypothetical protein